MSPDQFRTYKRSESVVFSKTKEIFGGLSNMAAGFSLRVNGVRILTSEALYQACRFPHRPEVQRLIIGEASPMTAKMRSKPYRQDSRPDWDRVRVKIMRWCLRVKLAQNWNEFSRLLLATRDRPIVEESRKDDFWGAKVVDEQTLVGVNVLGRLLMELREEVKKGDRERLSRVDPLDVPDFRLYGEPIATIEVRPAKSQTVAPVYEVSDSGTGAYDHGVAAKSVVRHTAQGSLFDGQQQVEQRRSCRAGLIDALKPYPRYRETGLSWLGEIPDHWDSSVGFAAYREKQVKNTGMVEKQVLSLSYGRIVVKSPEKLHGLVPESFETYQIVEPGDIIIRATDLQNDQTSLRVGFVRDRGIITSAYLCLKATGTVIPEYGYQLLHALDLMKVFYGMGSGLRQNLSFLDFKRMPIFIPPPDEQATIVRFLDYLNRGIERTIRAKRKVVALLNEQKQAIIHRTVTRGLGPNTSLRSSGIPWLGDIPAHWDVLRSKYVFREVDERSATGGEELLSVSHITGITPRSEKNITMFKAASYVGHKICRPGDLVINTMWAWMAALGISKYLGIISPAYAVYRPRNLSRLHGEYIDNLLRTTPYVSEYICRSTGIRSSRLRLYPEQFFTIPILLPPIEEQKEMVAKIAAETAELNIAINRTEREIELLREYRTRLIADIVMGKLDVREAIGHLPVEIEEAEAAPELEESEEEGTEELAGAGDFDE